jgi:hypothetical protein
MAQIWLPGGSWWYRWQEQQQARPPGGGMGLFATNAVTIDGIESL